MQFAESGQTPEVPVGLLPLSSKNAPSMVFCQVELILMISTFG
jgi:hypothetical protein